MHCSRCSMAYWMPLVWHQLMDPLLLNACMVVWLRLNQMIHVLSRQCCFYASAIFRWIFGNARSRVTSCMIMMVCGVSWSYGLLKGLSAGSIYKCYNNYLPAIWPVCWGILLAWLLCGCFLGCWCTDLDMCPRYWHMMHADLYCVGFVSNVCTPQWDSGSDSVRFNGGYDHYITLHYIRHSTKEW